VFDGLTLEPLAKGDIGGATVDTNEVLVENRVAVIVASEHAPKWYLALKESGHVAVVDYSQPEFPLISRIPALRYLHDGGWDSTGRYFMVAANASNSVVIVDTHTDEQVANFETGNRPHPGRGANWEDPEFGRVGSTLHMGEGKLAVYGTDPELPNNAWKVVRSIPLPSAGSLFHKTHPNSPWVLADFPLAADSHRNKVCAYSKTEAEIDRCWEVSPKGPAVHFEFNQAGTEFWVSVWAADGELVIYDAVTLAEKRRITGVHTPTGKFNVFNTSGDIY
jgi:nitrite reductase (NO-forming)/hydroxylamine reductase